MKTLFEVKKNTAEIRCNKKHRSTIESGCTLDPDWFDGFLEVDPTTIATFETLEEAQEELSKYNTKIKYYSNAIPYYLVTEYYLEEVCYDVNGDYLESIDVLAFSPMPKGE